jgi:alanyl-tRNA synthetase
MNSREIRSSFLEYFGKHGHEIVPSSPLVPRNDPTLMFVNAGMVQFKDVFTGRDVRPYKRATTSQKCIRISGKHNDLENVGVTARHHTFFEMLGNFSFGDYFKREAIEYGWDFITRVMGIDPSRLVVTVFGGEGALPPDEEAASLWAQTSGLPPNRILRCGAADNFWSMGDTGPCGPCSEIHAFIGDGDADPSRFGEEPSIDGRGWTEIWNLVFMQFDRQEDGTLVPLPAPSVDTGMGLERLTVLKQGVQSNYDTDLLRPIVDLAARISGKTYGGTLAPDDISMRVIADHARTSAFLVSEGVFPDNGKREYVVRRVMRRAVRHGDRLGIDRPFLHECALAVVEHMGDVYPELREKAGLIADITRAEEERFRRTLARGLSLLHENTTWLEQDGKRVLPGALAFKLSDTFGFPLDLQEVIGREEGFDIDKPGFDAALEAAKLQSAGEEGPGDKALADIYFKLQQEHGDSGFLGYDRETAKSQIAALVSDGQVVDRANAGQKIELVARDTPFYGEAGGQVGDRGEIRAPNGKIRVDDTQKPIGGLIVHRGEVIEGEVRRGDAIELEVDHTRRSDTRRNHSATHLLHYALRKVLGPSAMQKGSLVGPDRLRFDYSSSRPLTPEEIQRIEDLVNEKILANAPIETEVLPMDEAKKRGAIGIFEEKYGSVVRMLTMTSDSIELCGGTHASRTGDLGLFTIVSDNGLAAGVRRIEASTGWNTLEKLRETARELRETAAVVKAPPSQAKEKVQRLLEREKELEREIERLQKKLVTGGDRDLTADARDVGGVRLLGTRVDLGDPKALRELADQLRDRLAPAVVLLGTEAKGGKVLLACSVSKEITDRYHAGNIVKHAAELVGGGGGGRPDFAQAGGNDPTKLDDAVRSVYGAPPA